MGAADRSAWPHHPPQKPQRNGPPPLSGIGKGSLTHSATPIACGSASVSHTKIETPTAVDEMRGVSGGGGSTSTGVGGCLSDTEVNTVHSSTHQPIHSADTRSPCDSSGAEECDDPPLPHSRVSVSTVGPPEMIAPSDPTGRVVVMTTVSATTTPAKGITATTTSVRGPPKPIGFGGNANDEDDENESAPLYLGLSIGAGGDEPDATPNGKRRCSSASSVQGSPSMSSLHGGVKPFNPNAPSHYVMPPLSSSSSSYLYNGGGGPSTGYGGENSANGNTLAAVTASASPSSSYFSHRASYQRSPNYHYVNPFPSQPRAVTAGPSAAATAISTQHSLSTSSHPNNSSGGAMLHTHHTHNTNTTNNNNNNTNSNTNSSKGNASACGTTGSHNRSGSVSGFQHHHSSSSGTERCTPPVREAPTPSPSSVAANGGGFSLTAPFVPSTHSHHVDMYGSSLGCDATPFGNGMGETASLYHTAGGNPLSASSPNNNASGYYYMDSSSGYYEMGNTNSGAGGAQQTIGYNGVNGALHHLSSHNTLVPSSSIGPQTTLHGIFPSTSGLQPVGSLNSPSSSCYCTPTTRCANHLHAGGQEDFMCGGPLSTSLIHTNPNNNPPHPHHHHLQHLGVSMFEEFSSSPGAAGGDGGGYQLGTSPGGGAGASTSSLTALGRHPGFQSVLAHNRHNLHNLADGPFSDNEVGAPEKIQTIETLEDLEELCTMLLYSGDDLSVIALDLEGRDLGRNGTLCIITLATVNCVYLIDLISLGDAVLCSPDCRLRDVLESPSILKLMFDCRGDCEALFFVYHIRLAHVCDLQVASCCAHYRSAKHLPSMKTVLTRLGLLSEAEKDIKEGGRNFFSPEMGGSFDAWEERPLHPLLLQYCAVDVRHFFRAYHVLEEHVRFAIRISEERIDRVCAGHVSAKMAVRDFEIPS